MSYKKTNTLISRKGYSGIGGWIDSVGDALKGALTFYGDTRAAQGAAGAQLPIAPTAPLVPAAETGPSTTTLVIGGVAVAGLAYLLLKKKRS